jgi:hypothetical protein
MTGAPDDVRVAARKRLEERRGFVPHLIMFLVVNTGLVVIWVATESDGFFWPAFPLLLWGAGVLTHAWNAFFSRPISAAEMDREAARLNQPTDRPGTD